MKLSRRPTRSDGNSILSMEYREDKGSLYMLETMSTNAVVLV
jgi:hypothetical protein